MTEENISAGVPILFPRIDFFALAGLIDTVAGASPKQLALLLRVLFSSDRRLETRVVLELVLRCRDPLAPLESACENGLQTAKDFDVLLETTKSWKEVSEICPETRALALLNLCDEVLSDEQEVSRERRARCRVIRPRLKRAAVAESNAEGERMEQLAAIYEQRCPAFRDLLRSFVARSIQAAKTRTDSFEQN